ncbi:hypothetical protein AUR64_14265 [Haloprofundus marisrubri]|uniref:Uncharacterized protein n=1 Tax=Haloprofundus marisrubri TaxID=1514971 RepID=A0A0W1R6H8_9EURY|nr:hypothetical protein AUR64_14265 [Haloprofundus marisrubri]
MAEIQLMFEGIERLRKPPYGEDLLGQKPPTEDYNSKEKCSFVEESRKHSKGQQKRDCCPTSARHTHYAEV